MYYLAANYDKDHKLWPKVRAVNPNTYVGSLTMHKIHTCTLMIPNDPEFLCRGWSVFHSNKSTSTVMAVDPLQRDLA